MADKDSESQPELKLPPAAKAEECKQAQEPRAAAGIDVHAGGWTQDQAYRAATEAMDKAKQAGAVPGRSRSAFRLTPSSESESSKLQSVLQQVAQG